METPEDAEGKSCYPLGSFYRLELHGISGAEKMLSFLGTSLGARMDASRAAVFSRSVPEALSPKNIAREATQRYQDSQTRIATLCVLDAKTLLSSLLGSYPSMDKSGLWKDILRLLSSYFEAAGRLYLSDEGFLIGLCCATGPTDVELLGAQLGKFLRRFLSPRAAPSIEILRSRCFEAPNPDSMERFLRGKNAKNAP